METQNNEEQQEVVIEDPSAVLSALDRAKTDAKKFREEKEKLEQEISETKEAANKITNTLMEQKIVSKLSENGIKDPSRVLKYIQKDKISLDDNFDLVGFEDQFQSLKQELPEIFDPKLRVGGQADAAVQASVSTQYTVSQIQAMKVLGKI